MADAAFQKKRIPKRRWGRLLWVAVTNLAILAFSIYVLIGVYRDDIRINRDNPPPPSFGDVLHDNPTYAVACVVAGIGLLLEIVRRREAGFLNCGLWLALSIYAVAQNQPTPSKAAAIIILAVSFIWYVVPGKARFFHTG
jgi:hypothetical protein